MVTATLTFNHDLARKLELRAIRIRAMQLRSCHYDAMCPDAFSMKSEWFKDADGNIYTAVQDVKISATGQNAATTTNGSSTMLPVIMAVVLVVVFVAGWALYLRRKK